MNQNIFWHFKIPSSFYRLCKCVPIPAHFPSQMPGGEDPLLQTPGSLPGGIARGRWRGQPGKEVCQVPYGPVWLIPAWNGSKAEGSLPG